MLREKRMSQLLLVVGFTAIMVIIIIVPLFDRVRDGEYEYSNLAIERAGIDNLLAAERDIRNDRVLAAAEYKAIRERFISEAHINEVGRMLTRLCAEHNLQPIEQQLSRPAPFENSDVFLTVTASQTVSGTYDALKNLLDTVYKTDYLRISRVAFGVGDDAGISITFQVTMIRDMT